MKRWAGYLASALVVAATTAILSLFPKLTEASVALLLLLSVFVCASVWQSGPGVVAAILATLCFNFFFLPPIHTFTIADPRNVTALFVFLVSALLIGRLSALARRRLGLLEAERRDLMALTQLSQGFLTDTNREALMGVAADRLRQALLADQVTIFVPGVTGNSASPHPHRARRRAPSSPRSRGARATRRRSLRPSAGPTSISRSRWASTAPAPSRRGE